MSAHTTNSRNFFTNIFLLWRRGETPLIVGWEVPLIVGERLHSLWEGEEVTLIVGEGEGAHVDHHNYEPVYTIHFKVECSWCSLPALNSVVFNQY